MGAIQQILKRPSQRTQMEATLTGLTIILLSTIGTSIYLVFFSDMVVWLKIVSAFGGLGIFLLLFSNLCLTYIQYHSFKLSMGLYPPDKKLLMKLEEAKSTINELNKLIKEVEDGMVQ